MAIFDISKWRPPPSWIFKNFEILTTGMVKRSSCVTVPNFVEIGQTVTEMTILQFFKMAAAAILDFTNF